MILQGVLRKKGMIRWNERMVKLTESGILSYYHLDNPAQPKVEIDLTHSSVVGFKFVYCGRRSTKSTRPLPNPDDEFRLYTKRESFFFKDLKQLTNGP